MTTPNLSYKEQGDDPILFPHRGGEEHTARLLMKILEPEVKEKTIFVAAFPK